MERQRIEARLDPIEDLVGDLFVDRQEELDLFWKWGANVHHPMRNSWALIGRRRTGKTAILVKLFNRLFGEQAQVLPVFVSFAQYLDRREPLTGYDFARHYFTGYVGSYLAFRHRVPDLLRRRYNFTQFREFAEQVNDTAALELFAAYQSALQAPTPFDLIDWVIHFPKSKAAIDNLPTAIIDEFQMLTNIYDPVQNVHHDITDAFQGAVDTRWAHLLVSGSAVTMLEEEALDGLLSGRFNYFHIKPLSQPYSYELVFRLGEQYNITVTPELAEAVWQLTGGYPYSIERLLTSRCPAVQCLPALDDLEEILIYELSDQGGGCGSTIHANLSNTKTC